MEKLKKWLELALPFLAFAQNFVANLDDNDTGKDDEIAKFLTFVITSIEAIISDDTEALTNAKAKYANEIMQLPIEVVK